MIARPFGDIPQSPVLGIAREWANAFARADGLGALRNHSAPNVGDGSTVPVSGGRDMSASSPTPDVSLRCRERSKRARIGLRFWFLPSPVMCYILLSKESWGALRLIMHDIGLSGWPRASS
jgi:hypothetical protein